MGTTVFLAVRACCPLCGSPVLSVGRSGRVFGEGIHPIRLGRDAGRGYSLCDDCAILTVLPDHLTLN